jgi:hypothetical protein
VDFTRGLLLGRVKGALGDWTHWVSNLEGKRSKKNKVLGIMVLRLRADVRSGGHKEEREGGRI